MTSQTRWSGADENPAKSPPPGGGEDQGTSDQNDGSQPGRRRAGSRRKQFSGVENGRLDAGALTGAGRVENGRRIGARFRIVRYDMQIVGVVR